MCDDFSTARTTRTFVSVWLSFCCLSSFFSMSSSSISSVTPPCSPVAPNCTSCPAVQSVGKRRRFSSDDEIALFKEVLSHQDPFKWGSSVWDSVALNLCHSGRDFTPRLRREKNDYSHQGNSKLTTLRADSKTDPFVFFVSVKEIGLEAFVCFQF